MKKLYRSKEDRMIAGVCGGIAECLNIDSTIVRLIWAIMVLAYGVGVAIYFISILIIPEKEE